MAGITLVSNDTVYYLEQWGLWARTGAGEKLNYPSIQPFRRLLGGDTPVGPAITDDQALLIDGVIGQLTQLDEKIGRAIVAYYGNNGNLVRTAEKLGDHRDKARNWVDAGTVWVQCSLDVDAVRDL